MNSSTSSFKKTEWKVVVTVLLVLAGWELCARFIAPHLNYDRKHIHTFKQQTAKLSHGQSPRVLFLGNSLVRAGVEVDIVRQRLHNYGLPEISMQKFQPVGTNVLDWLFLYQTHITETGTKPDVVVVGFVKHHISDQPLKRLRRLGRHFISINNMPELFTEDIHSFGDQVDVFLSHYLSCFGDQPIHQEGLLYCSVPHYASVTKQLNGMLEDVEEKKHTAQGDTASEPTETFHRLERLMKLFADGGTHAILVAMPLPTVWDLDPKLPQTIEDAGMTFIDARTIDGIGDAEFEDGYHMNEAGKKIYSLYMADELKKHLFKKIAAQI